MLQTTMERLRPGEAARVANLAMFPLTAQPLQEFGYLTLDEAERAGHVRITELSGNGNASQVRLENRGEGPVLVLDGEELVGGKRNRAVNLTILVPAGADLIIPVACVERHRWSGNSREFSPAPRVHFAAGRAARMESVSIRLQQFGSREADQVAVWGEIEAKSSRLGARSSTPAMAAMYEGHAAALDEYVRGLPAVEDQCGAFFTIDGRPAGLDLFDHPATLSKLLPRLVMSYALDALDARVPARGGEREPSRATALAFLGAVGTARAAAYSAVGLGEDLRLTANGLTGGALYVEGRVVHLAAFPVGRGPVAQGREADVDAISGPGLVRRPGEHPRHFSR